MYAFTFINFEDKIYESLLKYKKIYYSKQKLLKFKYLLIPEKKKNTFFYFVHFS